jgi:hypothetical protein
MLDVLPGTGTSKLVSNAQAIGCSTTMESVCPSQISAILSTAMELALLPPSKKLLMLDAPLGTGTSKLVFSAQAAGSSTTTECVCPSQTNAILTIRMELA